MSLGSHMKVDFNVDGMPMPKGSKTAFVVKGRAVMTDGRRKGAREASASWRDSVSASARVWLERNGRPGPLDGPLRVTMRFRVLRPKSAPKRVLWPATRPDLDKLCRHAADALSGLIYTDDARVVELIVSKTFAIGEPPGVRITVEEIPPP